MASQFELELRAQHDHILHHRVGLYNKIQLLSATNTNSAGQILL